MKKLLALICAVLFAVPAFAGGNGCTARDLIGLSVRPEWAKALGCDMLVGNTSITGTLTTSGALTTTAGGHTITAGGLTVTAGGITVTAGKVSAGAGLVYPAALFETVAAGTSAQGDGPLAAGKFIHYVTGFDETKVVTLPACAAANIGETHLILNSVVNKFAKIFPASGAAINALGTNNAYSAGASGAGAKTTVCYCQAANTWYCG